MWDNCHWTAMFATIGRLLSAHAHAQQGPGVRGGFAKTGSELERRGIRIPRPPLISPNPATGAQAQINEKAMFLEGSIPAGELRATCDKRNLHRLIALALAAMFALAGSAATAESSLKGENAKEMERLLAVPAENVAVDCSLKKPPRTPVSALDRYLMWNEIALDTTAIDHTPNPSDPSCFGEQIGPHRSSYALAIMHIAMFDAENAITNKYVSYSGIPPVSGNVSVDRAIAQAAHDTLVALYPGQTARLNAIFDEDIVTILGNQASIDAGATLGTQAAAAILALRQNDGSELPEPRVGDKCSPSDDTCFPANKKPGKWQIDPISQLMVALGGNWPKVKPFVMTSSDQFRAPPPPPPSLKNEAYKQAFKEVLSLGGDPAHGTNTSRTEFETFMSRFWAYDGTPGLCAPPRLYNMITRTIALQQKMLALPEIARLFALVNVAMADAAIASWDSKYFYQFWRPVTAIREQSDPKFYPLGAPDTNTNGPNFTPPFPAYTSGHATFGGALFQILRQFWPDATPFTFVSDEYNGKNKDINGQTRPLRPASFKSFSEAEYDNAQSRIYMGIHWQFDADQGIIQGNHVADYVFQHAFRPVN
jgi:PAP2 superfamily